MVYDLSEIGQWQQRPVSIPFCLCEDCDCDNFKSTFLNWHILNLDIILYGLSDDKSVLV